MAVEAGGIGARLRAGREKMGLTVLQVAERIHTDPKIVEAVEAENYEVLGAPVYARGHIRHYAELVGESVSELIALYSDSSKLAQPDLTRIVKAPLASDSNKLVAPALVVIGVFAVAGAIWWVSALSKKKPQMAETHLVGEEPPPPQSGQGPQGDSLQAPGQSSSQSSAVGRGGTSGQVATQPRSETSGAGAGGQGRSGTASAGTGAQSRSATAGATGLAGAAGSGASGRAGSAGAAGAAGSGAQARAGSTGTAGAGASAQDRPGSAGATSGAGTSSAEAAPAHPKNQAQVTLRYSSDSWTEVYDANGTRLFYDVGAANSVQTLVGTPPLRVVLGNVSGVAVQFNGHDVPITNLALTDGSAQFSINRSGRVIRAKPVADGG